MQNTDIVATYDYYTLDQARELLNREKRRKRKQRLDSIKLFLVLFMACFGFSLLMIIHWIIFGY